MTTADSPTPATAAAGRIGIWSQSGGITVDLLARAVAARLGVSSFACLEPGDGIAEEALLQRWLRDDATRVVVCYLESVPAPALLAGPLAELAAHKPVVVLKAGRTDSGSHSAASHSGAMVADDELVDAYLNQVGTIRVDTVAELISTSRLLALQPLPRGPRLGVLSNGGGPAVIAADASERAGLVLPSLAPATLATLARLAGPGASLRNPVDLARPPSTTSIARGVSVLVADENVDAILVIVAAFDLPAELPAALAEVVADSVKPVVVSYLGAPAARPLDASGYSAPVAAFPTVESAVAALGRAARHSSWRTRAPAGPRATVQTDLAAARAVVDRALHRMPGGGWLDWESCASLCAALAVPVASTVLADDADDAVAAADRMGLPVAAKALKPDLLHKTEAGGVLLDLRDLDAVRDGHCKLADLFGSATTIAVQKMAPPGIEILVGLKRDPAIGTALVVAAGGVEAELIDDKVVRMCPLTDADVQDMVASLQTAARLFGYRGSAAVDVAALHEVMARTALLAELPQIQEVDLNPVVVSRDGAIVVDLRIRVSPTG